MTKQEADFIGSMNMCDEISNEAYKKIMCNCEDEEQEPCEDCVSRAYIEPIVEELENICINGDEHILSLLSDIKNAPSVTPQPKSGEWIEVEVCNCYATLKCSVCDRVIEPTFTYGEYSYDDIKEWYPYCHCGCRMNGGGEE